MEALREATTLISPPAWSHQHDAQSHHPRPAGKPIQAAPLLQKFDQSALVGSDLPPCKHARAAGNFTLRSNREGEGTGVAQ
jgi:hypothetical protein